MKWSALLLAALLQIGCGAPEHRDADAGGQSIVDDTAATPKPTTSPSTASTPLPEFRLRFQPSAHTVDADLELEVVEPTSLHLFFRTEWEGYPGLESRLRSLEAWSANGTLKVENVSGGLGAGHKLVRVERPGRVTISFTVALTPEGDSRFYHRVSQLAPDGGHLLGNDLLPLVWLGTPTARPQPARVWFTGMPGDWRAISVERRAGTAYELDDVRTAVFVVGPLRTQRLSIGPRSLTTGIYGRWPVSDERVVDAVNRIAGTLHRIAGDGWASGDYVLGAGRVPTSVSGLSTGGQVLGRSGIVYVGGNGPAEPEFAHWLQTTSHELMHWYIPTAFQFEDGPPAWFAEGVTDYMSIKTLLVGGLIAPQEFLDEIGRRLARYRDSPLYGTRSITDAEEDFWDNDVYRYIYDGGAVAAFLLDLGFQDRGGSLERALRGVQRQRPVTQEDLTRSLTSVRENRWLEDWLAAGTNPDWEARFSQYRLAYRNDRLISLSDWATDALSTIRP
jgi:predicted metalloprotease with PDZ domain